MVFGHCIMRVEKANKTSKFSANSTIPKVVLVSSRVDVGLSSFLSSMPPLPYLEGEREGREEGLE